MIYNHVSTSHATIVAAVIVIVAILLVSLDNGLSVEAGW